MTEDLGIITAVPCVRQLMSGAEAVAFAALDAGISYASSYPGTPTTNIQETLEKEADPLRTRTVWSINEKVSYESALGVAIAGQRALVSMKQVGLNVAADAFINSCPAGVNGGLVLVIGDDPEIHSSPHKQDSRMYRDIAGTILLEPADAQEAYLMTREAFTLSERFQLPVMLRLTMRTAYTSTLVAREPAEPGHEFCWQKNPERFFAIPTLARKLFVRLAARQDDLEQTITESRFAFRCDASGSGIRTGIICTGVGFTFAREFAQENTGILKVAGEPCTTQCLKSFIEVHDRVLVLEEGDPIIESRCRAFSPSASAIMGRLSGHLKQLGELQPNEIRAAVRGDKRPKNDSKRIDLPARIPEICKPCGYNKVYAALKLVPDLATPSDIGCNALGGLPPYSVMDGVWCMGASIGVACGLAAQGHKRVFAIIGDSTFFHAGIPPLIEAVNGGYHLSVLLLDNGTAAMTGGQPVPHRQEKLIQHTVDLVRFIEAAGASCTPFDPHKLGVNGIRDLVEESFQRPGVKVLLYRSQCGIYNPGYFTEAPFALPKREKEESL
jgi:indolepyruvate ferredoxin oxidoreductase alpha subunit